MWHPTIYFAGSFVWVLQYCQVSKTHQAEIQAQKEPVYSILKRRIRREYIRLSNIGDYAVLLCSGRWWRTTSAR